jgi:hypothetical protein
MSEYEPDAYLYYDPFLGYRPMDNKTLQFEKRMAYKMGDPDPTVYQTSGDSGPGYTPTLDPNDYDLDSKVRAADTIEYIYKRIMGQSSGHARTMARQWGNVGDRLDALADEVLAKGIGLMGAWSSPAAEEFLARGPGATIKSLRDWAVAAHANRHGLEHIATIIDDRQSDMLKMWSRYIEAMGVFPDIMRVQAEKDPRFAKTILYRMEDVERRFNYEAQQLEKRMSNEYWQVMPSVSNSGAARVYEGPKDAVMPPEPTLPGMPPHVRPPGAPGSFHALPPSVGVDPSTLAPPVPNADRLLPPGAPGVPVPTSLTAPNSPNAPGNPNAPGAPGGPGAHAPHAPGGLGPTSFGPMLTGQITLTANLNAPATTSLTGPGAPSAGGPPMVPPGLANPKKPKKGKTSDGVLRNNVSAPAGPGAPGTPGAAPPAPPAGTRGQRRPGSPGQLRGGPTLGEDPAFTGPSGGAPAAPPVLGRRTGGGRSSGPPPVLPGGIGFPPGASGVPPQGAAPPVLGGRRPTRTANPAGPADRPVVEGAEWVNQSGPDGPEFTAPVLNNRIRTDQAVDVAWMEGMKAAPGQSGATAPVLGRPAGRPGGPGGPGGQVPAGREVHPDRTVIAPAPVVAPVVDEPSTVVTDEDAFAVETPGGPVLHNRPGRPPQNEPKPTLGAG